MKLETRLTIAVVSLYMTVALIVISFIFFLLEDMKMMFYAFCAMGVTWTTAIIICGGVTNEEYAQTIRRRRELEEKKRQEKEKNKQ